VPDSTTPPLTKKGLLFLLVTRGLPTVLEERGNCYARRVALLRILVQKSQPLRR
jgi:hypothetical protein